MSLDKSIKSGKERRNPYRKPSPSCQNHGSCSFCRETRLYRLNKRKNSAKEQIRDYSLNG